MSTVTSTRISANKTLQVLNVLRSQDQDMPIGEAVSLMLIAIGETKDGGGLSGVELETLGQFSRASASRYAKALSDKDRHGNPGLELATYERKPQDDRTKVLRLTPKGHMILSQISNILEK